MLTYQRESTWVLILYECKGIATAKLEWSCSRLMDVNQVNRAFHDNGVPFVGVYLFTSARTYLEIPTTVCVLQYPALRASKAGMGNAGKASLNE